MKQRKILIVLLLILGVSAIWLYAGTSSTAPELPQNVPVSAEQQKELKKLLDATMKIYRRHGEKGIRKLFGYTEEELIEFQCRDEINPVDASLEVLRQYGTNIKFQELTYTAPPNSKHCFFITGKISDENKLQMSFVRNSKGYCLKYISEL